MNKNRKLTRRSVLASSPLLWPILSPLVRAEIYICSSCGYEHDKGDSFCSHCGKKLAVGRVPEPEKRPASPETVQGSPPASDASPAGTLRIPAGTVEAEITRAQTMLASGRFFEALIVARNARGLIPLQPGSAALRESLNAGITQTEARISQRMVPCAFCKGTGHTEMLAVNARKEVITMPVPHQACRMCKGVKSLPAGVDVREISRLTSQAERAVRTDYEGRGWEGTGGLFLPAGVGLLDAEPRERVRVLRSFGAACSACFGLGKSGCNTCKGVGRLPCSNRACVAGTSVCPACKGEQTRIDNKDGRAVKRTCDVCRGRGVATCVDCKGEFSLACEECEGRQWAPCSSCEGNGRGPECTTCRGEGLSDCRRCRGIGQYRDQPCSECQGRKQTICERCAGTGHQPSRR